MRVCDLLSFTFTIRSYPLDCIGTPAYFCNRPDGLFGVIRPETWPQ